MKSLLLMLFCLSLTAGIPIEEPPKSPVPLDAVLKAISKEDMHIPNVYDCSNKAGKYAVALIEADIDFEVWMSEASSGAYDRQLHAYIRFRDIGGQPLYVDPTSGRWARSVEGMSYPGFTFHSLTERNVPYVLNRKVMERFLKQKHPEWVPFPAPQ